VPHEVNGNGRAPSSVKVNKKRSAAQEQTWEYQGADGKTYVKHKVGRGEESKTWWDPKPQGVELDLYETTSIGDVPAGEVIDVTDGETDADAIARKHGYAVTSGTLSAFTEAHAERLQGRPIRLHADRDSGEGERQVRHVLRLLQRQGCEVEVVEAWAGKDAREHIEHGYSLDAFHPVHSVRVPEARHEQTPPEMREEAFHGIAGDFVRLIDKHTEADPRAVLMQTLVAIGNTFSRSPHLKVGADRHGANEYCLVVGDSALARKGTGVNEVQALLDEAVPTYNAGEQTNVIFGGLVSGEALVARAATKTEVATEAGGGKTKVQVSQTGDPRLLIIEDEFGAILSVLLRSGQTLSTMLRKGWDGRTLENVSLANPFLAREHHISIIAHVTLYELQERLRSVEMANGFGNRFLYCYSTRSKYLDEPGRPAESEFKALAARFASAYEHARRQKEMKRDKEARRYWKDLYRTLETQRYAGMLDSLTARSASHVNRLSLIFALLDEADAISREHLEAAHAVYEYSEATCRYAFVDMTGHEDADKILRALRERVHGMSRGEVSSLFSRNREKEAIDFAINLLLRLDLIEEVVSQAQERGRPTTRYYAL